MSALAILDAGLVRSAVVPCRIVFAGSSTTEGSGASTKSARYVDRLVGALQRASSTSTVPVVDSATAEFGELATNPGVYGYNAGDGGTTSADYLTADEAARIAALSPVMVVHSVGSNDFNAGVSLEDYRTNVETAIAAIDSDLSMPCVHVLLHQQRRRDSGLHWSSWEDYGQVLADIAAARPERLVFVDASEPFDFLECFLTDPYELGHEDDVHLTDTGHGLLATTVLRALGVTMPAAGDPILVETTPGLLVGSSTRTAGPAGGTFTTTEEQLDSVTASLVSGVQYKIEYQLILESSVADSRVSLRIREDNLTGTVVAGYGQGLTGTPANTSEVTTVTGFYTAVATGSKTFVGTGQRSNGTGTITAGANSTSPATMRVTVED